VLYVSVAAAAIAAVALVLSLLAWQAAQRARRLAAALTPDTQKLLTAWRELTPEQVAEELAGYLETVSAKLTGHEEHLQRLQTRSERMIGHRGLVRFDSDSEIKGLLSFSSRSWMTSSTASC